ncbi:hypothetical protein A3306_03330 [Rickettsia bellii]|uniref:Uncharacterized protein n=1 Tax=Rickettsia bellii str. RML An4 TaxID=1359193 RepID=A0A0F3QFL6_RICBE|nr:hypothetical protein [Rickettsia bellii]ARD86253.1 hypothetical protein A3306_03330 [Rickettsia bellii]KJV90219.1 hypothetical protein RBEAN4_1221 [Rickettsia bellii str. RML An4]
MSRLTITNSNNDLNPITIGNSQCMFTFKNTLTSESNVTIINDNSKGRDLSYTKIFYNYGGNDVEIETNNEGIIFNNSVGKFKVETKEAIIPADGFKITYHNNHGLNYTMISYDNGIIVEISAGIVRISSSGFGDRLEFSNYCSVAQVTLESEITISNHGENLIDFIIQKEGCTKNEPIIFNNLCPYSKLNSINIAKGKNFEQTLNDLDINELTLESAAKIQFTHNRSNYKFINPSPSNDLVIRNLYNIAEDAKNINTIEDYSAKKTGDYDFCHLTAFKFLNSDVSHLGDIPPDSQ